MNYIKIWKYLLLEKPDAAHLHVSERGSITRKWLIMEACHRMGVPVLFHHHGAEFYSVYHQLNKKKRAFVRKVLRSAELNLVLSQRQISEMSEIVPGADVTYLYNSVRKQNQNLYSADSRIILMLGRIGQRKGTYDLLQALQNIDCELDEEIQVWLCGDGEISQTRDAVKKMGLEHRVRHIGWIEGAEKKNCIKNSMMHVLPSYHEGLPMSILETMSYGIPNISTSIASIPEAIEDGVNGYLIEPGDITALENSIMSLVRDQERREQFSLEAYRCIEYKFSIDKEIRKLERIYKKLTEQN